MTRPPQRPRRDDRPPAAPTRPDLMPVFLAPPPLRHVEDLDDVAALDVDRT